MVSLMPISIVLGHFRVILISFNVKVKVNGLENFTFESATTKSIKMVIEPFL